MPKMEKSKIHIAPLRCCWNTTRTHSLTLACGISAASDERPSMPFTMPQYFRLTFSIQFERSVDMARIAHQLTTESFSTSTSTRHAHNVNFLENFMSKRRIRSSIVRSLVLVDGWASVGEAASLRRSARTAHAAATTRMLL